MHHNAEIATHHLVERASAQDAPEKLNMSRDNAIAIATAKMDSGEFFEDLKRRVAIPSDCQTSTDTRPLHAYLDQEIQTALEALGFNVEKFTNPVEGGGPFLVAERIESVDYPTALVYGHGDVVRGMEASWSEGLQPWSLTAVGNRWYGRGTADNKGQHSIILSALDAVAQARGGQFGFNLKVLIETGEERGSPGLDEFCAAHSKLLAADLLIASDGPRLQADQPTVFFGSRGIVAVQLEVDLRSGAHHSGNWGGLLRNPATTLATAISTLVDGHGRILLEEMRPGPIPASVKEVLSRIHLGEEQEGIRIDKEWGEPGLTPEERVFGWNTLEVLAVQAGDVSKPVGAIPGRALAHLQLRYVLGTNVEAIADALRAHLDAQGLGMVKATVKLGSPATRLDPEDAWPKWAVASIAKTTNKEVAVLPNLGGTLPNSVFANTLGLPTIWVPHSYPACSQHAPNEHLLAHVAREGLQMMAGLFWDLGSVTKSGLPQTAAQ